MRARAFNGAFFHSAMQRQEVPLSALLETLSFMTLRKKYKIA